MIIIFTWTYYTAIHVTTLIVTVFQKDRWRWPPLLLNFNCDLITAFHCYHKAAKIYNADLIFHHFGYLVNTYTRTSKCNL